MKIIIATLVFFSSSAFATDFSGTWTGSGKAYTYVGTKNQAEYTCSGARAEITQAGIYLSVVNTAYNCVSSDDTRLEDWGATTYTISGQDLMIGKYKVGIITDTKFEVYDYADQGQYKLTTGFELQRDGSMKFYEKEDDTVNKTVDWLFDSALTK